MSDSEQNGNGFSLTVLAVEEPGEECAEEVIPFEQTVVLDVAGLDPGSYNVTANERQVSFELAAEEELEAEATAELPPTTASVSGIVWHDSCDNIAAENAELPEGCILTVDNLFLADGLLADEDGIADVENQLNTSNTNNNSNNNNYNNNYIIV